MSARIQLALLLHSRVIAQDAGGFDGISADVIVERFLTAYKDGSLLDACCYHLAVVRRGKIEESVMCENYHDLMNTLIVNVHGGRELALGDHWQASK